MMRNLTINSFITGDILSARVHWMDRVELWLILVIAFLIPLHQPLSSFFSFVVFAVWMINNIRSFLRSGSFFQHFDKRLLAFSSIYLLFVVGAIYSSDTRSTLFDLQVKLPLLAFVLLFSTRKFPVGFGNAAGLVFIAGTVLSSLGMLGMAVYHYSGNQDIGVFYYRLLASPFHPTYFALYVVWSLAWLVELTFFKDSPFRCKWELALPVFLFLHFMAVLLSSKAGLLSLLLVWLLLVFGVHLRYRAPRKTALAFVMALMVFVVSVWLFPRSFGRIESASKAIGNLEKTDGSSAESTFQRVAIWNASLQIIREHWLTGVGTGDVKKALILQYEATGNTSGLESGLNVHNQFLQMGIALGAIGVLALVFSALIPFWLAIKRKAWLFAFFLMVVGLNWLFESMLERQAGVMFYAFFNALLFSDIQRNEP